MIGIESMFNNPASTGDSINSPDLYRGFPLWKVQNAL
jgi:hypothetical protein